MAYFSGPLMPIRLGERAIFHWNPDEEERTVVPRRRPARDLLDRIPLDRPETAADLGCGDGVVTRAMAARWPESHLFGVESDPLALSAARRDGTAGGRITYVECSVAHWRPPAPLDLVVSSSALHRLPDHDSLLPRLLGLLSARGVLAVQMPRNFDEPSHRCIAEAVRAGPWRDRLEPLLRPVPVAPAQRYTQLLAPRVRSLDVWETVYHHLLEGPDPVATWARETTLKPFLAVLEAPESDAFYAAYAARLRLRYPPGPDGRTLFPYRRLFLVAAGPLVGGREPYSVGGASAIGGGRAPYSQD